MHVKYYSTNLCQLLSIVGQTSLHLPDRDIAFTKPFLCCRSSSGDRVVVRQRSAADTGGMEHARTIIEELEREQRGEQIADPEAFARALETRALELHVESAVSQARGETRELMHRTVEDLTVLSPEQEEEAHGIGTEQLLKKLEEADTAPEPQEPAVLARALSLKAEEVRALLEERPTVGEQGSLAA